MVWMGIFILKTLWKGIFPKDCHRFFRKHPSSLHKPSLQDGRHTPLHHGLPINHPYRPDVVSFFVAELPIKRPRGEAKDGQKKTINRKQIIFYYKIILNGLTHYGRKEKSQKLVNPSSIGTPPPLSIRCIH